MIVREVLTNLSLLDNFDWFNDGQDTINWLKFGGEGPPAYWYRRNLIERMERMFAAYKRGQREATRL